MSIKRKLLLMVFTIMGVFMMVVVYAVLSFMPLPKISKELTRLRDLGEAILILRGDINGIAYKPMSIQGKQINESKERLDEKFKIIEGFEYLPELNPDIAEALDIISRLRENFDKSWKKFTNVLGEIRKDARKYLYTDSVKVNDFWQSPLILKLPAEKRNRMQSNVHNLITAVSISDLSLSSAYEIMQERYKQIDAEINHRETRLAMTVIFIIILGILLTLIFSTYIARSIGNSIIALDTDMKRVQAGDLTTEFSVKTRDEVGRLGEGMNVFTRELAESIHEIKVASGTNVRMKEELIHKTNMAASTAEEIIAAVDGIREEINDLDKSVGDSTKEVESVKEHIENLNGMIQEQNAMVEESTAAVTEMIASISNVNDIASRKKTATAELVNTVTEGGARLSETTSIISEITSSIDEIKGIAGIIQSVAAQTSLLSMNAAIEAAHAGKYGMGFAVVADEIGKLAETSGRNSRSISDVLKKVVEKIESASLSGDKTRIAFDNINSEITEVSASFDEIAASMNEINSGSRQILQAMNSLQDYSVSVQDGSSRMSESSEQLENAIAVVDRVARKVYGSIGEVSSGIDEISEIIKSLNDMSEKLSDIAEKINSEITRFKTEKDDEIDDEIPS